MAGTRAQRVRIIKRYLEMIFKILSIWFALNLAIPAFILWQRSPKLRHRLFRLTLGGFSSPSERKLAHALIVAAHRRY